MSTSMISWTNVKVTTVNKCSLHASELAPGYHLGAFGAANMPLSISHAIKF